MNNILSLILRPALIALTTISLVGCQSTIPKEALQLSAKSLENRRMQTRNFDTTDESSILSASAAVLQDLGFNIDESETKLGLIVGSKTRDATEAGQIAVAIGMAALFGAQVHIDKIQKLRASIVTSPSLANDKQTNIRVTFQRIVWNDQNIISRSEALNEPKFYQGFFEKLSKSLFLEAHKI